MRHVKIAVGLMAVACALGIGATVALAKTLPVGPPFEAKPNEKTPVETFKAVKGVSLKQVFKFPIKFTPKGSETISYNFEVTCEKTTETGSTTTLPSATLTVDVAYKECYEGKKKPKEGHQAKFVPIEGTQPRADAEFAYHTEVAVGGSAAAGWIEVVGPGIEIKLPEPGCLVTIGGGQKLEDNESEQRAQYNTYSVAKTGSKMFPEGFQDRLDIENTVSVINVAEPEEEAENVGLEFEIEPVAEPPKKNHATCALIPEKIEEEFFNKKTKKEEINKEREPRESVLGTYSGRLELELPKGQLKVS